MQDNEAIREFEKFEISLTLEEFKELSNSVPTSFDMAELLLKMVDSDKFSLMKAENELIELCRKIWPKYLPDHLDPYGLWVSAMDVKEDSFDHYRSHWEKFIELFEANQDRQEMVIDKIVDEFDFYEKFPLNYAELLVKRTRGGERSIAEFNAVMNFWLEHLSKPMSSISWDPTPYIMNQYSRALWYAGNKETARERFLYVYKNFDQYAYSLPSLAECMIDDLKQGMKTDTGRIYQLLMHSLQLSKKEEGKYSKRDKLWILSLMVHFHKLMGNEEKVEKFTTIFNSIKVQIPGYSYTVNDLIRD